MSVLLPVCIVGAPLTLAIVDFMKPLKEPGQTAHMRPTPAPVVARLSSPD